MASQAKNLKTKKAHDVLNERQNIKTKQKSDESDNRLVISILSTPMVNFYVEFVRNVNSNTRSIKDLSLCINIYW